MISDYAQVMLALQNAHARDAVAKTKSHCVYKYANPGRERQLPAGARPLFVANQRGIDCLWALVDPSQPLQKICLNIEGLRYVHTPGDFQISVPVDDDITLELPEKHLLIGGVLDPSTRQFKVDIQGDQFGPQRKFVFRLAGTGHPIGSFEARLLQFGCPMLNEDMSLVQHLFYVGVGGLL